MTQAHNPYAPPDARIEPEAAPQTEDVVWRDGRELVAMVGARFPERCVRCGSRTRGRARRYAFHWVPNWMLLLFLLSPLVYMIAFMIRRTRSDHAISMCETHERRHNALLGGACATAILSPIVGYLIGDLAGLVIGAVMFFGAFIVALLRSRLMRPVKIDADYARYRGASPGFLAHLPAAPPFARRR